ncbi:MAG: DsbA family protein [Casimicrobiaceae bacterium]
MIFALTGGGSRAAPAASSTPGPDAATIDSIIQKMEASGAFDAAVDRAINRYVKRKEQARQAEEAKQQAELGVRAKNGRPIDAKRDHIRGNLSADVSLIEYSDFECPFCKRFHDTPKEVLKHYGGRVNWVLRNYPLAFHDPAAQNEALAAECVARLSGNDAYWKYADALFAITRSNGTGLPADKSVDKLAEADGIKSAALTRCMGDPSIAKRVQEDIDDGNAAGVTGTPTTVVRNNRTGASQAVVGAVPIGTLLPVIDQLLGAKP